MSTEEEGAKRKKTYRERRNKQYRGREEADGGEKEGRKQPGGRGREEAVGGKRKG